jgi:hypothetical protein
MPDNVILNPGSGGATIRTDNISGIETPVTKIGLGTNNTDDGLVFSGNPLPVVVSNTKSPQQTYLTTASVAAGSSTTLDSNNISNTKTGKLLGLVVSSSVPIKVEVRLVNNGVATSNKMVKFCFDGGWDWISPGKDFISVPGNSNPGNNNFRVIITNLDILNAADVFVTFFWNEE